MASPITAAKAAVFCNKQAYNQGYRLVIVVAVALCKRAME
jgi:hypothetical protein